MDDDVFKALAAAPRRKILDRLSRRDGQTVTEICKAFRMSRFGTMKHLRVVEKAGLVVTKKVGREKLHYLNPAPIQLIHDRWISKYAVPFTRAMSALKHQLEEPMPATAPEHVYELYIRTTPEKLWAAITSPEFTRRYFFGAAVELTLQVGAPIMHRAADGSTMLEGQVLESTPPRRLVHTFLETHDAERAKERPSRVTWEIEPRGEACRLTLTHDDFDGETLTYKAVESGWNVVLSGLKTLLETGAPLNIAAA